METELKTSNVQAEMCFVGSLYTEPDLYVSYGNFMRSKYDFSDPVTRFLYDNLEIYYLTFSQTVDEKKINVFMSQNESRLQEYKQYKGWKTIQSLIGLADISDVDNYFNLVKKFSLLREYERNGFPVDKILKHKRFDSLTANDIYRIIRIKADKINTVINAGDEAVELTKNNADAVNSYIDVPLMGMHTPWYLYNEMFLGLTKEDIILEGFLSNEGKTRKLMKLAAYVTLVQNESFLVMSNEMSEKKLRSCLITTVLNNKEFKELHGVKLMKPEKEIILGAYRNKNGEIIYRKINEAGDYIETKEEYLQRIQNNSDEYWDVIKVGKWIDEHDNGKLLFKDVGNDYSDNRIEFELRKYRATLNGIYYAYDTLKGYRSEDWSVIKQSVTRIKELTKELGMSGFLVFQLTDDTVFTDVFSLSSNNIAGAKGMKHVTDALTLGKRIPKDDYHKYQIVMEDEIWGEPVIEDLDYTKQYFAIKADKNRAGDKDKIMAFEIELNYNIWYNIGYLIKKPKKSE
ncbi:MAG: hypothetical protein K1W19_12125 [Lachnospiraceae bacterium]